MNVEITGKTENHLAGRQEVKFVVKETKIIPSRMEIRKKIAAMVNADEKNVVVGVLETRFGSTEAKGTAKIYKDEKHMKEMELPYIRKRNFGPDKEDAKAGAPKAENAEEKPAEANKK
ncbi:MAG: 30S ribosomal protein S24e [archaeon]